jgi:hypothetical protein
VTHWKVPRGSVKPTGSGSGPSMDVCLGDATAHMWRDRLRAGDWRELPTFLRSFPDPDLRDFYITCLSQTMPMDRPRWLDEWVDRDKGDHLPFLFRGAYGIHWAWDARGHRTAEHTSAEAFRVFHDRLDVARFDLETARYIAPHEVSSWAFLLTAARGLGYTQDQRMLLFEEGRRRGPVHQYLNWEVIQSTTPKWGGSVATMLALARDISSTSPTGSNVHSVLIEANIEAAFDASTKDGSGWKTHLATDAVVAEIELAASRARPLDWAVPDPRARRTHSMLLATYLATGDAVKVRSELDATWPVIAYPFMLFGNPIGVYNEARSLALSAGAPS